MLGTVGSSLASQVKNYMQYVQESEEKSQISNEQPRSEVYKDLAPLQPKEEDKTNI